MSDVVISKLNESFVKILCPKNIRYAIKERYKFFAEGYKFHPLYKNPKKRVWDGKVSLFNLKVRTFPIGLLSDLTDFLDSQDYTCEYDFETSKQKAYHISDAFLQKFYQEIFCDSKYYPRDYQHEAIRNLLYNKRGVVEEATGCHIAGTDILMVDGSIKKAETVLVGDKLMGKEGNTRTVLSLIQGNGQLYKIIPHNGDSFIVNEDHILHLQYTNKSNIVVHKKAFTSIDIPVSEYLKKSKTFKHMTKLVWNDSELIFSNTLCNPTKLIPYFVGIYLGNGDTYSLGITSMDNIADVLIKQADLYGIPIKNITVKQQKGCYRYHILKNEDGIKSHPINNDFKKIGLCFTNNKNRTKCEDKFIPDVFKYGHIHERYEILAGLIDTDGHLANRSFYEYTSKSKQLRDDVAFVARSLGFFVTTKIKHNKKYNKDYYKCSIQGDIGKIPVRVERKKYKGIPLYKRQKKHNISGFKIEPYNCDTKYYGFRLDSDGLYMLSNYMVTHNSGKSLIIYCLIRYLLGIKRRIVLIVPNIMLVEQMRSDFKDYGWKSCDECLTIMYMGHTPDVMKPVLVSTYQSLIKRDDSFIMRYNAVIVDEAHQAPAHSIQTILSKLVFADYRLGMTGTLPDHTNPEKIGRIYEIYGYIGPLVARKPASELIEEGYLSQLKIAGIIIKYPEDMCLRNRYRPYEEETITITENPQRNKVFGYVLSRIPANENTIILCYLLKHLDMIHDYCQLHFGNKFKIRKISGEVGAAERIEIKQEAEDVLGVVICATFGTMSVGVNIKRIHNIVLGSSYKSKERVLQTIGRGLRKHESKNWLTVFDIVDDLRWMKRTGKVGLNHVWEHFEERLKHYKMQGFECTNHIINLEDL